MKNNPKHPVCGKVRHTNQSAAIASAIRSSKRGGTPLRVYRCPGCKGFHLTKRPEWSEPKPVAANPAQDSRPSHNVIGHHRGCPCTACAWLDEPISA